MSSPKLLLFAAFLCFAVSTVLGQQANCAPGWSTYNFHCYKFQSLIKDYSTAKRNCEVFNTYLVEINSEGENDFVANLINPASYNRYKPMVAYIGLYKNARWSRFLYSRDGAAAWYTRWASGEPNNGDSEQICAGIYSKLDSRYKYWVDLYCHQAFPFICESG